MPYPAARSATLDPAIWRAGGTDGVAVVLEHEDERQLVDRGEVQALVDVALVAAPLAHRGHGHLARLADLGGEGDADRVEQLGRDRRRDAHQVVLVRAVVTGHLPTAGPRVVRRRVLGGQDVARTHPEGQAGRDRAIERGDPVMPALERPGDADLGALVPLPGDDERDSTRPVEDPHPLVEAPGQGDEAVHLQEVGVGQADRGAEAGTAVPGGGHRCRSASCGPVRWPDPALEVDRAAVDRHGRLADGLRQRRVGVGRRADSPTGSRPV